MSFDASPLLAEEPEKMWRIDATEGGEADHWLLRRRSEAQWSKDMEERTKEAEHDDSQPARNAKSYLLWRALLGEVVGTFLLIFVACGTPIAVKRMSSDPVMAAIESSPLLPLLLNNLTVALAVVGIIYSLASVSGAHVNPVVTLAMWTAHHTSIRKLALFTVAQFCGGLLGLLALLLCYNFDTSILEQAVVHRLDGVSYYSVFAMETLCTFTLIFVVLRVSYDNFDAEKMETLRNKAVLGSLSGLTVAPTTSARLGFAPLAIGFIILVLGVLGGAVSGAAMNPVRFLAPAIVRGQWDAWMAVYVLGEALGAMMAVGLAQALDAAGSMAEKAAEEAAELRKQRKQIQQRSTDNATLVPM